MDELFYKMALSQVDGIGSVKYKKLFEYYGNASAIFKSKVRLLKSIDGISETNAKAIIGFNNFQRIEKELAYCEKHSIQILDFENERFPQRLLQCFDAPSILFCKGSAQLNQARVISVIGTRQYTDYGRNICNELIEALKPYQVLVCSGLAFGIDAIAHKASLKNGLPTVGVVAHGLDTMYPAAHHSLSDEMLQQGAILSEYFSGTRADKANFPTRNRIVAGMADAVIIIETAKRGGSMITAEFAHSYNRDIFCLPGRSTDTKSSGCNDLIKSLKGQLFTDADDIIKSMGWASAKKSKVVQKQLFINFNPQETSIIEQIKVAALHVDQLQLKTGLNSSALAATILSLEMQGILKMMPGKLIKLIE